MKKGLTNNTELVITFLKNMISNNTTTDELRLPVEIHDSKNVVCLWEEGGSFGTNGTAIVVLDNSFRSQRPLVCVKPRRQFNGKHALIEIYEGCIVLGGYFENGIYVVASFEVHSFEFDHQTQQNHVVLYMQEHHVIPKEEVSLHLPYRGIDTTKASEYMWTPADYRRVPSIAIQKMTDYMAMHPKWIKHWASTYNGKEANKLLSTLSMPTTTLPASTLQEFYENILAEAHQHRRSKNNRSINLWFTMKRETEDMLDVEAVVIERCNSELDNSSKMMTLEGATKHLIYLDIHQLKSFWYPDQDPWQKLKNIAQPTSVKPGRSHTAIYKFIG